MMGKLLKTLFCAAALATAFTSCSKDDSLEGSEPMMQITINAGNPNAESDTRTELNGTRPMWSVGDQLGFFTDANKKGALKSNATEASPTATFSGEVPVGTKTLYVFYPCKSSVEQTRKGVKVEIPTVQNPSETGFDGMADMLMAKPIDVSSVADGKVNELTAQFARTIGVLKVNVKGSTVLVGEKLEQMVVRVSQSDVKGLTGHAYLDVKNTNGLTELYYGQDLSVTAAYDTPEKQFALNGNNGAYLCVYPQTLAANTVLTIEGVTEKHTFKKEITLKQPIEILSGKLTTLNVALGDEHIADRKKGAALPFTDDFAWTVGHTNKDVSKEIETSSNGNFVLGDKVYAENGLLRLGVSKSGGYAVTKDLDLSQPYTIVVEAKSYGSDNSSLIVKVGGEVKTQLLTATATAYTFEMPAATAAESIRFESEAGSKHRLFLTKVDVVSGHGGIVLPESINITSASPIELGWIGGEGVINYTIENPKEGLQIAAASDQPWVNGFTCADGVVKFNVDKNDTASVRTAKITLTYGNAAPKEVEVKQDMKKDPVLTVANMEIGSAAGTYSFDYTLENPDGSVMKATTTDAWITNIDTSVENKVSFNAAENTDAERTGKITLTYGAITKEVVITQVAAGAAAESTLTIDLTTKGYGGNGAAVTTVADTEPLSVVFAGAKYYDGGTAVRMYAGNTLTIGGGKTITKVVFGITSNNKGKKDLKCGDQTINAGNNWTWENVAGVPEVVFTGTANHTGIQTITITYK